MLLIIIILNNFEHKTKLLGNTEADGNNEILKNTTNAVTLKCLGNFLEITRNGIN